jgi:hypothetical protein
MQGKALDPQQKQKFLAKLRASAGNVSKAAKAAGISRASAYDHKKLDSDFAGAWDGVIDDVVDAMEEELHRRSTKGILEPVFYKGEMIAKVRKFSDRLLEFALKSKRPDQYRERFDVNQNIAGVLDLNIQATINQIYADPDSPEAEPETESPAIDSGTDQDG